MVSQSLMPRSDFILVVRMAVQWQKANGWPSQGSPVSGLGCVISECVWLIMGMCGCLWAMFREPSPPYTPGVGITSMLETTFESLRSW